MKTNRLFLASSGMKEVEEEEEVKEEVKEDGGGGKGGRGECRSSASQLTRAIKG